MSEAPTRTRAWIFPTLEACDAAVAEYRFPDNRGDLDRAEEIMSRHGGVPYGGAETGGFIFQVVWP
jgi:hypothetical protein